MFVVLSVTRMAGYNEYWFIQEYIEFREVQRQRFVAPAK
jgi:hypothetical protein